MFKWLTINGRVETFYAQLFIWTYHIFFLLQLTQIILINLEIECAIFYFSSKQTHILKKLSPYKPTRKSIRVFKLYKKIKKKKIKDEDEIPHTKLTVFLFLSFFFDSFQAFSYAYGGLHIWSPLGKKQLKLGLMVKENRRKRKLEKKEKRVKHIILQIIDNKKTFQIFIYYLDELVPITFIITTSINKFF